MAQARPVRACRHMIIENYRFNMITIMIEKLKYLCAGTLALAAVVFVACDDDDEGLNGWTDTAYVYVRGETLGNDITKQAVVVETEGMEDTTPFVYTFRACISTPAKADATVSLTAAASGGIADMLENTMSLNTETLKIPAGQLVSEEATLTIDPAFLAITDEQKTYDPAVFTVTMSDLKTTGSNVKLTTKTNKVTVTYQKVVKPYINLASGTPSNAEYMDRTNWSGTLGEGVEGSIDKIFDGSTGTDIAANNAPWEFTLDLGAETTMLGANTRHWGVGYAPSSIEVFTSSDNMTWKSQSTLSVSGSMQNWRFIKPVAARYLKYRVLAPNKRTDLTEFNIYVAKE